MTERLTLARSVIEAAARIEKVADGLLDDTRESGEYHTGSSLLTCYAKLESDRERLLMWREMWNIPDSSDDSRLEVVWSETAINAVKEVVAKISKMLGMLEGSNSLLRSTSVKNQQQPRVKTWLKRQVKPGSGGLADTRDAADLFYHAGQLSELIDELFAVSEKSFRSKQSQDILLSQRSQLAAEDEAFLRQVQAVKKPLQTVFRQSTLTDLDLSLEMDLFRAGGQIMSLHLFVDLETSNNTLNELLIGFDIVQAHTWEDRSLAEPEPADISNSILRAMESGEPQLLTAATIGSHKSLILRIERVSKPTETSIRIESFSSSLQTGSREGSVVLSKDSRMSLVDKIRLAFKIVECGLWLLSTPWLSNLRGENLLEVTLSNRKNPVYVLPTRTIKLHDIEDEMIHWLSSSGQISSIGTLLIEIALEKPFSIRPRARGFEFETVLEEKVTEVEKRMGRRYGRAVDFCLRNVPTRTNSFRIMSIEDDDDQPEEISQLLEDYYLNVYTA